ncbi:MAG: dihydrofolate reductase [Candidatus ainarchaeum sp.]|nr:dihydrofolate reductase [Candidatus ainarchaeum sp.]
MCNEVIIIAAAASNNVIGKDNKIPWHFSEDFKHFKELTLNHPIIMGKNTFLSLPKKPLPNRDNIVLTFKDDSFDFSEIIIKHSLEDSISYAKQKDSKIYIIGGAFVYKQAIEFADKIELTKIYKEYDGDTYFPEIDLNKWDLISEDKKEFFSFQTYIRKKGNKYDFRINWVFSLWKRNCY